MEEENSGGGWNRNLEVNAHRLKCGHLLAAGEEKTLEGAVRRNHANRADGEELGLGSEDRKRNARDENLRDIYG